MKAPSLRKPLLLSGIALTVIVLLRFFRYNRTVMQTLFRSIVRPFHLSLISLTGKVSSSIAEILILSTAACVLVWLAFSLIRLFHQPDEGRHLLKILLSLLSLFLCIYAGFSLLWGVYYYSEDFSENTGIASREVSVEELEAVTAWFAEQANRCVPFVPRDENGLYAADRPEILLKSKTLYRDAAAQYPALQGPEVPVKPFFFSRLLSLIDFTGFFFPFTGEANVNMDCPPALFAASAAHELAHQRGVAREQEANFCAVLSSLMNGDPDYCYSASLLAYIHLSNALYGEKPSALTRIRDSLDERVLADLAADRAYWAQFETPVRDLSQTVYEEFLQGYDQELGLKSYGACTDLLVSFYLSEAEGWASSQTSRSPEEIRAGLLDPILSFYPATAGSSLGRASAAAEVLSFAAEHGIVEVSGAYTLLTEEEKTLFSGNVEALAALLSDTETAYEEVAGLYEDAGVSEAVCKYRDDRDVWSACHALMISLQQLTR